MKTKIIVGLSILISLGSLSSYASHENEQLLKNEQLIKASRAGNSEEVLKLLALGACKNTHDYFGFTPLHLAVAKARVKVVEILLKAGANTEVRNRILSYTPLHFAAGLTDEGYIEIVTMLLCAGAQVNAAASLLGQTPLDIATEHNIKETVDLLKKHGACRSERHLSLFGTYNKKVPIEEPSVVIESAKQVKKHRKKIGFKTYLPVKPSTLGEPVSIKPAPRNELPQLEALTPVKDSISSNLSSPQAEPTALIESSGDINPDTTQDGPPCHSNEELREEVSIKSVPSRVELPQPEAPAHVKTSISSNPSSPQAEPAAFIESSGDISPGTTQDAPPCHSNEEEELREEVSSKPVSPRLELPQPQAPAHVKASISSNPSSPQAESSALIESSGDINSGTTQAGPPSLVKPSKKGSLDATPPQRCHSNKEEELGKEELTDTIFITNDNDEDEIEDDDGFIIIV